MHRKKNPSKVPLPTRLSAVKLRKVTEITHDFFPDFLGDVQGFRIDLEGFAASVMSGNTH